MRTSPRQFLATGLIKQAITGNKQVNSLPHSQLSFPDDCGWSSSAKGWQSLWRTLPDFTAAAENLSSVIVKTAHALKLCTALCACNEECQKTTE